jgi:hypothetical protein
MMKSCALLSREGGGLSWLFGGRECLAGAGLRLMKLGADVLGIEGT